MVWFAERDDTNVLGEDVDNRYIGYRFRNLNSDKRERECQ